jgi:phosphoribosylformimino-5-aminoimidazole carboxamide ribotide isomerase
MKILPVLDLCGGIVVRAVAGRRSEYRPLVSRLTDSTDPLAVATAIRERFGWTEFYLADLNAIAGAEPAFRTYDQLRAAGFRLWLDAGVRDVADAERLAKCGVGQVVVGLETVHGPAAWRAIVERLGAERVVFSLDLRDGRPLTASGGWDGVDVGPIVERVVTDGGRRVVVLDLARVGTGTGTNTEIICAGLVRRHPGVEFYAGGGVRDMEDVRRMSATGVAGVLVASALHDGQITQTVVMDL